MLSNSGLKKTLESPLDSKEIKPVNPKGNQPWIFIRRTDAEAEVPILCHLMQRANSLEKTLMLGKLSAGPVCVELISRVCVLSGSVVSNSLHPHGLRHARPPCPSPTPGVYSNSCPLSWWCHLTISSSVVLLSSCLQSFPESGSFQMNQLFTSGFSFSISPSNEYSGLISFRMDWLDLLAV